MRELYKRFAKTWIRFANPGLKSNRGAGILILKNSICIVIDKSDFIDLRIRICKSDP